MGLMRLSFIIEPSPVPYDQGGFKHAYATFELLPYLVK